MKIEFLDAGNVVYDGRHKWKFREGICYRTPTIRDSGEQTIFYSVVARIKLVSLAIDRALGAGLIDGEQYTRLRKIYNTARSREL